MFKRIVTSALVFGMACIGPPAWAATCAPRDSLVEQLSSRYAETLTARGLQSEGALIEIFASPETGTYTVLLTRPDGISCVVSAGTHWLVETPAKTQEGVSS